MLIFMGFIGNTVGLILFSMSKNYIALCVSRFLCGLCQTSLIVYLPLYVDAHAKRKAAEWLANMLLAPPVGVIAGSGITAILILTLQKAYEKALKGESFIYSLLASLSSWRMSFFVQGIISLISAFAVSLLPSDIIELGQIN